MLTRYKTCICVALTLLTLAPGAAGAADTVDIGDGTRVKGVLEVTCTPDEKSTLVGAKAFDDTISMANDRVVSSALDDRGYGEALSIPKSVNGMVVLNVVFQKRNGKATYTLRVKKDGAVTGSLTVNERNDRFRYTVRNKGAKVEEKPTTEPESQGKRGKSKGPAAAGGPSTEPAVLRVDGGFVRLMTAQVALAQAGVKGKATKAKVVEIITAAGTDQIPLKGQLLSGTLTAEAYADAAGRRLQAANDELAVLLGDDIVKVDAAYEQPITAEFLHHNALRAALADLGAGPKVEKASQSVYRRMVDLALLMRNPGGREPAALKKFRAETIAEVKKALPPVQWARVEKTVDGLTSSKPGGAAPPAPAPIELD